MSLSYIHFPSQNIHSSIHKRILSEKQLTAGRVSTAFLPNGYFQPCSSSSLPAPNNFLS